MLVESTDYSLSDACPLDLIDQPVPSACDFNVSQELRTPLTAIQVALDLLGSGKLGNLSETGQRMVEIATSNADRLLRLASAIDQQSLNLGGLLSHTELERLRLEADLELAIERRELRLQYQPIVWLHSGQVIGLEALLRWQHPIFGNISPATFIPLAETSGLILQLGDWVLRSACQQLQTWQHRDPDSFQSLSISVNLSSKQLSCPGLALQVGQTLQEAGLAARHLRLEITESGVMDDAKIARQNLSQLHDLGVQLYIDDFGTGFSSLSRLCELPLDVLKIDRSFVQQLDSQKGRLLVRAIINLAHNLGIDVIAEGVETAEQVTQLQALGCSRGQGFFFAKPIDSLAVETLLGQTWQR